jgi:quercetin dioxygenase-like cupin family protein
MSREKISTSNAATILSSGEGETLNILGDRYVVKVGATETGGLLTTVEATIQPQSGLPPHIHQREDETFYILEGEFEFLIGDKTVRASPGAFVYAPRGRVHTFKNISATQARLLLAYTPAGIEAFYRRLNALPPGPPDVARVIAIAQEYGIAIPTPE